MHSRGRGQHRQGHSYSGSVGQKAQLTNAYQALGTELASTQIKTVGNYTLGRVVGEGSFGKVRLAVNKLTSQRCAVKQIPRLLAPPMLTREIHHHRRLHHPNVLQLFEVIATEASIWLVSELCAGGELFDYLVEKGRLSETEAKRIFGQLCLGVGYIHRQGVVHRDLKLENVLLDERCNVKVADFGFGREFEQRRLMETFCGTTGYASPEMLAGQKYLGEEVDIWSLGIILYALLTGSLPFDDDDEDIMKRKILVGEYDMPTWLSPESQDLISSMLRMEPRDRISIRQILGHDWFTKPPPVFSPSPNDYFQHGDFIHDIIPEESGSNSPVTSKDELSSSNPFMPRTEHLEEPSVAESVASTTSWHSAASTADSDGGLASGHARQDSPITSDDADDNATHTQSHAAGQEIVQGLDNGASGSETRKTERSQLSRHPSQSTITRSDSRHSIRHHFRPSPNLSAADSPGQSFRFPSPGGTLLESLPPGSPALPMPAHSRTPSRTKRRSIGSTMSERLMPMQENALPDFVALLDQSSPVLFSTAAEKSLLDGLALIGMDTGQMIHSVRNNACDASGAIWWQLKMKADQRDQEIQEAAAGAPATSESMSSLSPSVSNQQPKAALRNDPEALQTNLAMPLPELSITASVESDDNQVEILQYSDTNYTESPRKQRIQVPGSARSSVSAPLLGLKGDGSGPPALPTSTSDVFSQPSPARSEAPPNLKTVSSREIPKVTRPTINKPRSASVSTVSMLQRATSALGVRKERPEDKAFPALSGDGGKSTPNLLSGGFFGRKTSSSSQTPDRPTPVQKRSKEDLNADRNNVSPAKALNASMPSLETSNNSFDGIEHGSPPLATSSDSSLPRSFAGSPGNLSTETRDTGGSLGSYTMPSSVDVLQQSTNSTSSTSQSFSSKGRASKKFFSTFKLWFNEDKRKHKQRQRPPSVMSNTSPVRTTGGSIRRTHIHAPSPLQRPPIARMPSNTPSSVAPSRRNSSTSIRRLQLSDHGSPLLGHHHVRRRSDASRRSIGSATGARTPTSERDHSRPPSAQSGAPVSAEIYNATRKRHARASSSSSAGSRHSTMISGSPVATYRRTPAVTQVRRISTPKNRYAQSRNASNPSSNHSASSRRSSISVALEGEETIMEEENENLEDSVELERTRALRKLSGDPGEEDLPSADRLTAAAVAAVDALSGDAQPRREELARHSRQSSHQRSQSQSHASNDDHHGHHRHGSSSSLHSNTVFAAHKVVNPFGTPNGSHFNSSSIGKARRETHHEKPKLRDVFKRLAQDSDDGWVDEEEGLYTGGFGQASTRSMPVVHSSATPTISRTASSAQTSTADSEDHNAPMLGEGRYAGVSRTDCAIPALGGPRPRQAAKGPSFKRTATVVEEEEEEEE